MVFIPALKCAFENTKTRLKKTNLLTNLLTDLLTDILSGKQVQKEPPGSTGRLGNSKLFFCAPGARHNTNQETRRKFAPRPRAGAAPLLLWYRDIQGNRFSL